MKIQSQYLTNLLKLMSSSVVAQLLIIASSPILTRLYSPDDFGIFALFIGLIGILSTIISLRYEQAIIIPKDDDKAKQLVYLSLLINAIVSIFVLLFLFVFAEKIFNFFHIEDLLDYYWIVPFAVFLIGCFQVFNYWLIRNKEFNKVAKIKIQQSVVIIVFQFVFYKIGAISLILGHSLGQLLGVLKNGYLFFYNSKFDKKKIIEVAREYKKFPIYSTWSSLLNSVGAQLPVLIFTAYYSPVVAGLYMLTQRVIKGPLSIVGQAVTQIFVSSLREEESRLKEKIISINKLLIFIALTPFAVIVVAGEKLFSLIFGNEWAEAGLVASILSPWMLMVFLCSPISSLVEYKNKQEFFLKFQISLFIFRVLSIYIGYLIFESYIHTLILFSILSTCLWVFFIFYMMKLCNLNIKEWLMPLIRKIIIVSCIFIIFHYGSVFLNYISYWLVLIIVSIISMGAIYEKGMLKSEI